MPFHVMHLITAGAVLVCAVFIAASLGTPWTQGNANYGVATLTVDFKLFQQCASSASQSQCQTWTDVFPDSGAQACSDGSMTAGDALRRVQLAGGTAVVAMIICALHCLLVLLWAIGKINLRVPHIITGILTISLAITALGAWGSFLSMCSKSLCDSFVDSAIANGAYSASCGPNAGLILPIIAAICVALAFIPLGCCARPTALIPGQAPVVYQQFIPADQAQYQQYPQAQVYPPDQYQQQQQQQPAYSGYDQPVKQV